MARNALIAGGTGLTGGHCLDMLLEGGDCEHVIALGRRPAGIAHPKLVPLIGDFDRLQDLTCPLRVDVAFCALGTTLRRAGSREAFATVDRDYVVAFAQLAKRSGARVLVLVSALGANPHSRIFYNRIKGEAEAGVRNIGFESLHIFRPSLLTGERRDARPAERAGIALAKLLNPLLVGPLRKTRAIPAREVAALMIRAAARPQPGVHLHYPSAGLA